MTFVLFGMQIYILPKITSLSFYLFQPLQISIKIHKRRISDVSNLKWVPYTDVHTADQKTNLGQLLPECTLRRRRVLQGTPSSVPFNIP
jgi:hypothetical protein